MELDLSRQDVMQRLLDLDEEASLTFTEAERMHLVIAGGGALVLMKLITRATHDIDALYASRQLHELLQTYDINTKVQSYAFNFPFNHEDRFVPLDFRGKLIDFYTASLEDIVISKLQSPRPKDQADIEDPYILSRLDWVSLHNIAYSEEEWQSVLNERQKEEFLIAFEDFERRHRPCDS